LIYFWNTASQGQPEPWSSYLCFPQSWDDRYTPPHPSIGWDGVLLRFCLGWSQILIRLISTSQVAGIKVMSHHARPTVGIQWKYFEIKKAPKSETLSVQAFWKKDTHLYN
jgi:hypothetical protein